MTFFSIKANSWNASGLRTLWGSKSRIRLSVAIQVSRAGTVTDKFVTTDQGYEQHSKGKPFFPDNRDSENEEGRGNKNTVDILL